MGIQTITTPSGERLVVLPEKDYARLVAAAEDNVDRAAVVEFRRKLESGEEELIPSDVVDRLLDGENPVKVWREYRGLSASALALKADIAQSSLSQIELGKRHGQTETLRRIALALAIDLVDLLGPEEDKQPWQPAQDDRFNALLQPGVRLTTNQIAEALGFSVSHVNKALNWRLEKGLVTCVPGTRPRLWMVA